MECASYEQLHTLLNTCKFSCLATVNADGTPWLSPLYVDFDAEGSVYWVSPQAAAHSSNVRRTGKGFMTLFNTSGEANAYGIYLKIDIIELSHRSAIQHALQTYSSDVGTPSYQTLSGKYPRRMYRGIPTGAWTNAWGLDPHGNYIDGRKNIDIQKIFS